MTPDLRERLMRRLIRVEEKRNRMYRDSRGIWTIGIGHNLEAKPISDRAVAVIFEDDLGDVERDVERELPWVAALSLPRQMVIFEMVFNMGIGSRASGKGLLGFTKMLAAAQAENWEVAAEEVVASDAFTQTGRDRYKQLAQIMLSGEWPA